MKKIVHILKKEDKRLLHSFLKKNNALTQFKRNCRYRGFTNCVSIDRYNPDEIITRAFYWADQPEGNDYWCNLSTEWRQFLKFRKMHK